MKPKTKIITKKITVLALFAIAIFAIAPVALAADFGLGYGTNLGLGTQDLRVTIMRVVQVALGFLGIIAIILFMYGGWLYLSSAGNEEKISRGKQVLINAVIGLVIIFTSFAIVSFIINFLGSATGSQPPQGFTCTANQCVSCGVRCNDTGDGYVSTSDCSTQEYCSVPPNPACPKPDDIIPTICRIEPVRGVGFGGVPQGYVGDFVTIEGWYLGIFESGVSRVKFDETEASIATCDNNPIWYTNANRYSIIRAIVPSIELGTTNVLIETSASLTSNTKPFIVIEGNPGPGLACLIPPNGKNNDLLTKAEGVRFGDDPDILGGLFFNDNQKSTFVSWSDEIISQPTVPANAVSGQVYVKDADGIQSNGVWFTVSCTENSSCASGCCKSFMCQPDSACQSGVGESCDNDINTTNCEPGSNCADGLVCNSNSCLCDLPGYDQPCDTNLDLPLCQGGSCAAGYYCQESTCTCQEIPTYGEPIIYGFTPTSGAVGTYVTISGGNFGPNKTSAAGHVYFIEGANKVEADYTLIKECADTFWHNTQIVVKVPAGLVNGNQYIIEVENSEGKFDTSGLNPSVFTVDENLIRPNICKITPDNGPIYQDVEIYGENLNPSAAPVSSVIFSSNVVQSNFTLSTNDIFASVPAGSVSGLVKAKNSKDNESNGLYFQVGACVVGGCQSGYECCQGGRYNLSCMPEGGCYAAVSNSSYDWTFTTGARPGNCSNDSGICIPNNDMCSAGYTCDTQTCNCTPTGTFNCSNKAYPVCEPNSDLCPDNQFCGATCTCLAKIPCDGNVATPACQPSDDICRSVDSSLSCDPETCYCDTGFSATKAAYDWTFNSYTEGPQVVDECNRTPECAKVCANDRSITCSQDSDCGADGPCIKAFSSPSPKYNRDGEVYANSQISVSFDQEILPSTVNSNTIKLYRCNQDSGFLSASCSVITVSSYLVFDWDYGIIDANGVIINPVNSLEAGYWYKAEVTAGVIGRNGFAAAPYSWLFKIKAGTGSVGCATCQPGYATLFARYDGNCSGVGDPDCQPYLGQAWDQDHVCVMLKPETLTWNWNLLNETDKRASIFNRATSQPAYPNDEDAYLSSVSGQGFDVIDVYARKETLTNPVKVATEINGLPSQAYQYGENICDLSVDLSTPIVVKRWPDCNGACTNASVGAAFSIPMNSSSITASGAVVLYACADNANCRPGYGVCSVTGNYCNAAKGTGCGTGETCQALDYDQVSVPLNFNQLGAVVNGYANSYLADSPCFDINADGKTDYCLLPNTYYRVILRNTIEATNGKKLGKLNYDDALYNGLSELGIKDSYSWVFRTQDNMCAPGRISVQPEERHMSIYEVQKYASYPYTSPDSCDAQGQPLIAASFVWEWQSKYCQIADLFSSSYGGYLNTHTFFAVPPGCTKVTSQYATLRSGCGNGVVGLGEDCDDGNIFNQDGCSSTCLNEGVSTMPNYNFSFDGIPTISSNTNEFPFESTSFSLLRNYPLNGTARSGFGSSQNLGVNNSGVIYAQSDNGRSGLMRDNWVSADHYFVSANIKLPQNTENINDVGLIFGYLSNNSNYFAAIWSSLGYSAMADYQQLKIIKAASGLPQSVANTQKIPADQNWHEIKVEVINYDFSADIKLYFDDNLYLTYKSNTRVVGNAGIYAYDTDGQVLFDNLKIYGDDLPICGNGILEKGEECEKDQAGNFGPYCTLGCLNSGNAASGAVCGNGVVEPGEECDNGNEPNNNEADGCTNTCILSGFTLSNMCGNGIVDKGEACDNGDFTRYTCLNNPSQVCDPNDDTACGNQKALCTNRAKSGDGCTGYYQSVAFPENISGHSCSTMTETQCKTFSETSSDNHAKYCYWTGTECRIRPCISETSTAQGNDRYDISICGNGLVEAGEECDYGSLCQTSYGGVARCTSLNASTVCASGICGQGVCQAKTSTGYITNQYVACTEENAGDLCYSGSCELPANSYLPGCTSNCLNAGSVSDNRSHQIAQGLADGQTEVQAWTSEFKPSSGGPMGIGKLFVGAWGQPEDFYVIDQWPNCFTACLNADIGAQFSQYVNTASLTTSDNIKLYECRTDSGCNLANATKISGLSVIPFTIKTNSDNRIDAVQLLLPNSYNPVNHDNNPSTAPIPALLPDSYYRVVISKNVRTDSNPPKNLQYLNFNDPTVGSGTENDSYSWVFKTQNKNNFCALSSVKVLPQTWQMFTGNKRQLYFSRPISKPDECSVNGQLLNPFYFDWRWDDVEMSQDNGNFINGADILIDTLDEFLKKVINGGTLPTTPPTAGGYLKDGCGNGVVEFGEDCDPGLQSIEGCSNTCQHAGSGACSPTVSTNCCGNSIIEPGEECEPFVNGGFCTSNGLLCDPFLDPNSCPGGTCLYLCDSRCRFAGNTNTQANCGDGVISPIEICDGKLGDDSDGCSDYCQPSGAVPATGSTCGNGIIEKGEECDGGELASGNIPLSFDGNNCSGIKNKTGVSGGCTNYSTETQCQSWKGCYWSGNECKHRPCIIENRNVAVCRNSENLSVDFKQNYNACKPGYTSIFLNTLTGTSLTNRPVCGNGVVEPGEECDLGGWCIDEETNNFKTCTTYNAVGCRNNICLTYSYYCSVDGLPIDGATTLGACSAEGICDSNKNCVVAGPGGSEIEYPKSTCTTIGAACSISGTGYVNGCSSNCVYNGSRYDDGINDPYQIVQSVGVFSNTVLTEVNEEIRAWHALQPDRVGVGELTILASANVPFTVVGHQPKARGLDPTNQCRNVGIWAILSRPLDATSVTAENLYLGKQGVEDNLIKSYSVLPVSGSCNENHRCVYPGAEDSPLETSYCYVNSDCVGSKIVINEIEGVYLDGNSSYVLRFKQSLKAQDGSNLQELNYSDQDLKNYTIWGFDTSADFCSCNYVGVNILNTTGQAFTTKDYFTCAGDNCGSNTYKVLFDDDYKPKAMCRLSGQEAKFACDTSKSAVDQCGTGGTCSLYSAMAGNQHLYNANCYDTEYSEGTDIPVGLGTAYDFAEIDPQKLIYLTGVDEKTVDCTNVNGQCLVTPGDNQVPAGKNGDSQVMVSGKQYMDNNNQICTPTEANAQTCLLRRSAHQTIDITNFICDNPWPALGSFPYTDSNASGNSPTNSVTPYYNFTMYYCRDYGKEGFDDDLPSLNINGPVFGSRGDVLKEFLFPVGTDVVINAPGSPKRGVDFLSNDCTQAGMGGIVPSNTDAYRCNVNSHFRYKFTGVEKGYYKLVYQTYNYGSGSMNSLDLYGLKMCDKNKNGYINTGGATGETTPCNTQADCASLGTGIACLPVTQEIDVYHVNVNDTVPIARISAIPRAYDNMQSNEVPVLLEAGDHTFRFRWINDWNVTVDGKYYDSNLIINKVSLIKVENEATSDAIGLRILPNTLHLSASTWYNTGLCGAQVGSGVENICYSNNDCAGINLFKNANFEDTTKPWVYEYNTLSPNVYHNQPGEIIAGGRSGKADKLAGQSTVTTWGYQIKYPSPFDLPAGNYVYSAWIKSQDGGKVGITVQETTGWSHLCSNKDCTIRGDSVVCANTDNEWHKVTCTFSLAKKTQVQMAVRADDEAKTFLVDDVSLTTGCNFNLPSRGTAQPLTFDGYNAASDGRSLYVNATNFNGTNLFSNIFLLSYTQNASESTKEIFRRLSDQTNTLGGLSFNANMTSHRLCSGVGLYEKTSFICNQVGVATDCRGYNSQSLCESEANLKNGCYWSETDKICSGRMCLPIYCQSDKDCPNLICDNQKGGAVRDNLRFGNLRDMQLTLERSYKSNGSYPKLSAGTYIASTTFAVWPSWQATLGSGIGSTLPSDPLNYFTGCVASYCDTNENGTLETAETTSCLPYNVTSCNNKPQNCLPTEVDPDRVKTCWDEKAKEFSCPQEMYTYAYRSSEGGKEYELYTNFEFITSGWVSNATGYQLPFYGTQECKKLNFEIHQTRDRVSTPIEDSSCAIKHCWGASGILTGLRDGWTYGQNNTNDCEGTRPACPSGYRCTGDADSDGVCDEGLSDNCAPLLMCSANAKDCYNPDQRDSNGDGRGDVCDQTCSGDKDGDTICDNIDNCPTVRNTDQLDHDGDTIGDACDPCTDMDSDGYWDYKTAANDEKVCPQDNCSPFYNGYCQSSAGDRNGQRCHSTSDCVAGFNNTCFIPFTSSFGVSNDRPKYCIKTVDGKELFASKEVCSTACPTGYTCKQALDSSTRYFNPNQEDYDNSGRGYICNDCLDYDQDGLGDWTFYAKSSDVATAVNLTFDQKEHFAGCRADQRAFVGFGTPSPATDLDNCPGGPYSKKCYDNFGVETLCSNPPTNWSDENNNSYVNSQADIDLNHYGDICDPSGDGRLDPGEACDCGDLAISQDEQNPFQCTTLNDVECAHSERYGDCCKYCATDLATGQHYIAQSCGPRLGDGIVNGSEECDCGENQIIRDSITDPPNIDATATSGISCLTFDTARTPRTIFNGIDCGPITQNGVFQWSMDGYSCQWCDMGRIEETTGPYFGDGIVDTDVSGGLEQCDCGDAAPISTDTNNSFCVYGTYNYYGETRTGNYWTLTETAVLFNETETITRNIPCISKCSSFNGQPCTPQERCDGVCGYCRANDTNTGSIEDYSGHLCLPCSSVECNSICINLPNDGCCRDGETADNEYGCPFKVGDQILIKTRENNTACGSNEDKPWCHPSIFLKAKTRLATDPGIFGDGTSASPFYFFKVLPGDEDDCRVNNNRIPELGSDVKTGDCIKFEITSINGKNKVSIGSDGWITVGDNFASWVINIVDGMPLKVGSIISLKQAGQSDDKFWSTRWKNVVTLFGEDTPVGTADKDQDWEKFKICNRANICSNQELIQETCTPPATGEVDSCANKYTGCHRCVAISENLNICSEYNYTWNPDLVITPILLCSGANRDYCCNESLCNGNPNDSAKYDIDCDGVKINEPISLNAVVESNGVDGFEFLTGGTNSSDYVHTKGTGENLTNYRFVAAISRACRSDRDTVIRMPGAGNAVTGGGDDNIRDGDCISLEANAGALVMNDESFWNNKKWLRSEKDGMNGDVITREFSVYNYTARENGIDDANISYGDIIGFYEIRSPYGYGAWWQNFYPDEGGKIGNNPTEGWWSTPMNDWSRKFKVCKADGVCAPICDVVNSKVSGCPEPQGCYICQDPGAWSSICLPNPTYTYGSYTCGVREDNSLCAGVIGEDNCCVSGESWLQDRACPLTDGSQISMKDDHSYSAGLRVFLAAGNNNGADSISGCGGPGEEWDWRAIRLSVTDDAKFTVEKCDKYKAGCTAVNPKGPIRYGEIVRIKSNRNYCPAVEAETGVFSGEEVDVEFGDGVAAYFKLCSAVVGGNCAQRDDDINSLNSYPYIRKGDKVYLERASWNQANNWWAGNGKYIDLNEHSEDINDTQGDKDNKNPVLLSSGSGEGLFVCDSTLNQSNCYCREYPGTIVCGAECKAPQTKPADDYCNTYVPNSARPECDGWHAVSTGKPECGPCSESNCQLYCANADNDGCCKGSETISNEYACPILSGSDVILYSVGGGTYIDRYNDWYTLDADSAVVTRIMETTGGRDQNFTVHNLAIFDGAFFEMVGDNEDSRICNRKSLHWWLAWTSCDNSQFKLHLVSDSRPGIAGIQPGSIIGLETGTDTPTNRKCYRVRTSANSSSWAGYFDGVDCPTWNASTDNTFLFIIQASNGNQAP